jgi:hypothetical protein
MLPQILFDLIEYGGIIVDIKRVAQTVEDPQLAVR